MPDLRIALGAPKAFSVSWHLSCVLPAPASSHYHHIQHMASSSSSSSANASTSGICLELKDGLVTPGSDAVSGVVNVNVPIAKANGIIEVVVKLIGEIKT